MRKEEGEGKTNGGARWLTQAVPHSSDRCEPVNHPPPHLGPREHKIWGLHWQQVRTVEVLHDRIKARRRGRGRNALLQRFCRLRPSLDLAADLDVLAGKAPPFFHNQHARLLRGVRLVDSSL
jgi:hypothetical protein